MAAWTAHLARLHELDRLTAREQKRLAALVEVGRRLEQIARKDAA